MKFQSFLLPTTIPTQGYLIFITLALTLLMFIAMEKGNDYYVYDVYALSKINLTDFNFAAAGDWACTINTKNTVDNMISKNPELILGLGDYAYRPNPGCWYRLIDPIDDKMKITIGNHEHLIYTSRTEYFQSPKLLNEYMNYFNLSRQYYSFDYQNVHFIAMSTEIPYETDSAQYKFVKRDLQKAASNQTIDWIVVFYHRVAYTSPNTISAVSGLNTIFHPLFEKYGVDLIIQAHAHNYQRSYPISYNEDSRKPIITDKNKADYSNPRGQIFTIVGTAGAPDIHNLTGTAPFTANQFNAFGFLNIDVLQNGTVLEGKFYENNGPVRDHFTIVKSNKDNERSDSSFTSSSSSESSSPSSTTGPRLMKGYDDKFKIETVTKGLRSPTDITFLGPDGP